MTRGVVVVSCHLTIGLLSFGWWFLGGLPLVGLCTTQVLSTSQYTGQLFRSLTKNRLHASFVVPSLKYLHDNLSHTAAVKILVGPLHGSCFRQVASGRGSTVFFTFSFFSSSDVGVFLSSRGFKNPSGTFNCTRGRTTPFMTVIKVILSVILARVAMLAQTSERCSCAWATCLKMSVIKAISSTHLAHSGNLRNNSSPDGISSGGSTTLMPPAVKCCHKYKAVGSLIILSTMSVSAAPMLSHCLVMIFLKF